MIFLFIIAAIVAAELIIKTYIDTAGAEGRLIGNIIRINRLNNYGIAGGHFRQHPLLLRRVIAVAMTVLLGLYALALKLHRGWSFAERLALALVLGGGLSNLIDRCIFGYVRDYFSFVSKRSKKIGLMVYNLADIFIFAGTFIMLVLRLVRRKK